MSKRITSGSAGTVLRIRVPKTAKRRARVQGPKLTGAGLILPSKTGARAALDLLFP